MKKLQLLPLVLVITLSAGAVPLACPAIAATVDVSADGTSYLVDGGVLHHSRYEQDRYEAATCTTCHWRVHIICASWDDTNHGWCPNMVLNCPRDQRLVEIFRANAASRPATTDPLWHRTGYSCITSDGPVSAVEVRSMINEEWRIRVPELRFTTSPPSTTLVNLKTTIRYLSSGSTGEMTHEVAGIPVTFRAGASRFVTCVPGCLQSRTGTTAYFTATGGYRVTATAVWSATYDALGLTDIPVADEPIRQTTTRSLTVVGLHRRIVGRQERS